VLLRCTHTVLVVTSVYIHVIQRSREYSNKYVREHTCGTEI